MKRELLDFVLVLGFFVGSSKRIRHFKLVALLVYKVDGNLISITINLIFKVLVKGFLLVFILFLLLTPTKNVLIAFGLGTLRGERVPG